MLLYIDPGTGSMLFAALISIFGAAIYFLRIVYLKLKFKITGGKKGEELNNKLPLVIFSDHKRYWNSFGPICRELDRRGQKAYYFTLSEDDPGLSENFTNIETKFLGDGNKGISKMNYLNASIVLATTPSLDVFQWKRSKKVGYYVHMFHAASNVTMYRTFGIDHYDAILLSGMFQIDKVRKLEELRNLPLKELSIVGIPYMDEMKQRIASMPNKNNSKKTVLVAPSWGPSSLLNKFGSKFLDLLLETDYNIIIRPHPQSFTSEKDMIEELMTKYPNSERLSWNDDNDNFNALYESEIMISDFSSVIFDYSLVFDKPVIYLDTKIDLGIYDAWWINDNVWTLSILPYLGQQLNEKNLKILVI